jgi:hypothetical protein
MRREMDWGCSMSEEMRVSGKCETSGRRTAQRLGFSSANQARKKAQETGLLLPRIAFYCLQ